MDSDGWPQTAAWPSVLPLVHGTTGTAINFVTAPHPACSPLVFVMEASTQHNSYPYVVDTFFKRDNPFQPYIPFSPFDAMEESQANFRIADHVERSTLDMLVWKRVAAYLSRARSHVRFPSVVSAGLSSGLAPWLKASAEWSPVEPIASDYSSLPHSDISILPILATVERECGPSSHPVPGSGSWTAYFVQRALLLREVIQPDRSDLESEPSRASYRWRTPPRSTSHNQTRRGSWSKATPAAYNPAGKARKEAAPWPRNC